MKPLPLAIVTYAVFVLQATLAPALAVKSFTPHFVLLALVPTVLQSSGRRGLLYAAAWGLLSDCLTATGLGADVIAFSLTAFVLQIVRRRSTLESPVAVASLAAVAISANLTAALALRCWRAGQSLDHPLLSQAVGSAAYTGLLLFGLLILSRTVRSFLPAPREQPSATVGNRWRMLTE